MFENIVLTSIDFHMDIFLLIQAPQLNPCYDTLYMQAVNGCLEQI